MGNTINGDGKNLANLGLKENLLEFAAMLKEGKGGNSSKLSAIIARFSVQEGVRPSTVKMYLDMLAGTGLVTLGRGKKRWKYNSEAEWDLFQVPIDDVKSRGR